MKTKRIYFELMRIIACALVIFNHLPGYRLYGISRGGKQFFYMCLTMITRINVPLFFMISGALLFAKNEDIISVLKKRFIRIVGVLLLFDIILVAIQKYLSIVNHTDFNMTVKDFFLGILGNTIPGSGAYWYMYAYLGLLFVLPFFQRLAKGLTKNEVVSLLILHFITSSLLPMLNLFFAIKNIDINISLCGDFQVPFAFMKAYFYTILGYYLEYYIDIKKIKSSQLGLLITFGILGIILSNTCTYFDAKINGTYSQNYVQLFDYVTAIVVFVLIKYLIIVKMENLNMHVVENCICFLGSMTLGIYMLDPCFKQIFYNKYNVWAEAIFPTLIVSLGWIIISMTLGTLCTYLLKRTPIIKTIL